VSVCLVQDRTIIIYFTEIFLPKQRFKIIQNFGLEIEAFHLQLLIKEVVMGQFHIHIFSPSQPVVGVENYPVQIDVNFKINIFR